MSIDMWPALIAGILVGFVLSLILDMFFWQPRYKKVAGGLADQTFETDKARQKIVLLTEEKKRIELNLADRLEAEGSLQEIISEHETRAAELENRLADVHSLQAKLQAELAREMELRILAETQLDQEKAQLEYQIISNQNQANTLQQRLNDEKERGHIVAAQLSTMRSNSREWENKFQVAQAQIASISAEYETHQEETFQNEMNMRRRIADLNRISEFAGVAWDKLNAKIENQKSEIADQRQMLQAYGQAHIQLKGQIGKAEKSAVKQADRLRVAQINEYNLQARLETATGRAQRIERQLSNALLEIDRQRLKIEHMQTLGQSKPGYIIGDDLQRILGIGKVYAQKLNAAGIYSFAQLESIDADKLQNIINPKPWQNISFESWREEARRLTTAN